MGSAATAEGLALPDYKIGFDSLKEEVSGARYDLVDIFDLEGLRGCSVQMEYSEVHLRNHRTHLAVISRTFSDYDHSSRSAKESKELDMHLHDYQMNLMAESADDDYTDEAYYNPRYRDFRHRDHLHQLDQRGYFVGPTLDHYSLTLRHHT